MSQDRKTKEWCDCDVNILLDEAKKNWHWWKCMRWNETTWHLYCPKHHVYIAIGEAVKA